MVSIEVEEVVAKLAAAPRGSLAKVRLAHQLSALLPGDAILAVAEDTIVGRWVDVVGLERLRSRLVEHPGLEPSLQLPLMRRGLYRVLGREDLLPEVAREALDLAERDVKARVEVARYLDAPWDVQARWVQDLVPVRRSLAGNDKLAWPLRDVLARDSDTEVARCILYSLPVLPEETLCDLARTGTTVIAETIATRSDLTFRVETALRERGEEPLLSFFAASATPATIPFLLEEGESGVHLDYLALNPNLTVGQALELFRLSETTLPNLTENLGVPKDLFRRLLELDSPDVDRELALGSATPHDVLASLVRRGDEHTVMSAARSASLCWELEDFDLPCVHECTSNLLESVRVVEGVDKEVWDALLPGWSGSARELVEACGLV